jgi:hypothetical protein
MIVSWIRHSANASTTGPVLAIQERMGMEGVGLYWVLFEAFLRSRGARRRDDRLTRSLAFEVRVDPEKVSTFLTAAVELGIMIERDGFLVFEEVQSEIARSEEVAKNKRQAASARWNNGYAGAMQLHSRTDAGALQAESACIVDKIREEREEKKEEKRKKEETPTLPPVDLSEGEKKSLLDQMGEDELAYWLRAVALYRLRRPETARDNAWAAIQNWRERARSEGQTWNHAQKTYLHRRAQDPPDERAREKARILELKKKFEEEEKRVAHKN